MGSHSAPEYVDDPQMSVGAPDATAMCASETTAMARVRLTLPRSGGVMRRGRFAAQATR